MARRKLNPEFCKLKWDDAFREESKRLNYIAKDRENTEYDTVEED